jgi:acetoin utilization deacetylase AcuC-like enzyme
MRRTLFYCDNHEIELPPGHKFPMRKYRLVRELLAADGQYEFEEAPFADVKAIEAVHDPAYVQNFLAGTLPLQVQRRIGFPWSQSLVNRTLASVGGTLKATEEALRNGFGGNLAGGTHHAFRGEGSGFCVFNDIAVAVHWLRKEKGIGRAAIVDLDVHQGDGTAAIFEGDEDVLTLSVHGRNNFPFRKQRSRIDIDLEDHTGDEEYLAVVESALLKVLEWGPEVIFYQSGVDGLECDLLGRLSLTLEGLRRRDLLVTSACAKHHITLVITQGGGYGNPIEQTAVAHANTYRSALQAYDSER